jgi:hypothetical protein
MQYADDDDDRDDVRMAQLIGEAIEESEEFGSFCWVRSFDHAGVLSGNAGLVIEMGDGSEYQVTVVQSALPRRDR